MSIQKKNIGIVLGVIVLVCGIVVALVYYAPIFMTWGKSQNLLQEKIKPYTSGMYAISFSYPDSYDLQERDLIINKAPLHLITLAKIGATIPENGEGSTVITLSIFELSKPQPLADWLRTMNSASMGSLQYTERTVGGEKGLMYTSTGLYESDNIAIEKGNHIYIFSATWMTRDDQILKDFEALLSSTNFTN